MAGNTFGKLFRVTTAGVSHGPGYLCIVDGCPAGLEPVSYTHLANRNTVRCVTLPTGIPSSDSGSGSAATLIS